MKKKLLILVYLLFLTGCTVNYNIDVSDNKIEESSNFYYENKEYYPSDDNDVFLNDFGDYDNFSDIYFNHDYLAFSGNIEDKYYKKEKISDSNGDGINLKYTYNFDNYGDSFLFNIFDDSNYVNDDDEIIINVRGINFDDLYDYYTMLYDDVSSLAVNIKTDLKVLKSNADSRKGNIYTWNINSEDDNDKDKEKNKDIYIRMRKKVVNKNYIYIIIVILIFIILIVFSIFYIIKKKNDSNEI